jgi:hypothetical protein
LVRFDEKSVQLPANLTAPLALQPGRLVCQDYEYQRNGTHDLFVLVGPQAAFRQVLATYRSTGRDFALVMRYLVDEIRPDPECAIDIVMDNLNTYHH